jgi:Domain of unknown function (DUF1906)/Putative peptidoglycan binding domain
MSDPVPATTAAPAIPVMIRGLDADADLSRRAGDIRSAGFEFILPYLKVLTTGQIAAYRAAGLAIGPIFEAGAQNALGGRAAGFADGQRAIAQLQVLGIPAGTAVAITVDKDITPSPVLTTVLEYFAAFGAQLQAFGYRRTAYADGTVLTALQKASAIDFYWLAGAMGWSGSRELAASASPVLSILTMLQGPTLTNGGGWDGIQWPDLGFEYDPDLLLVPLTDSGLWLPETGTDNNSPVSVPAAPVVPIDELAAPTVDLRTVQARLVALGYSLAVDGLPGPATTEAIKQFQTVNDLEADGIIGPLTLAALNLEPRT